MIEIATGEPKNPKDVECTRKMFSRRLIGATMIRTADAALIIPVY